MTDIKPNATAPTKLAIWSVPRSLSTVLTRSISAYSNCEVYFEYYSTACFFGPERVCSPPAFRGQPPKQPEYSYEWVKKTVEKVHPEKQLIVIKDTAYAVRVDGEFKMLPNGFKHTFMIRHPAKVFRSIAVMIKQMPYPITSYLPNCDCIFKELLDLHHHVTAVLHQSSVIIDADDIIKMPEDTLRSFCKAAGISFLPEMLHWERSEEPPCHWNMSPTFREMTSMLKIHQHAYQSTGIDSNKLDDIDMSKLSQEICDLTEKALPSYQQLYERRLRP